MNQNPVSEIVSCSEVPTKNVRGSSSSPIRHQKQAKEKLNCLLNRANKNRVGRKIRGDDLLGYSLDPLTEEHLKDVVARRLTNKERIEFLCKHWSKTKRGLSRE